MTKYETKRKFPNPLFEKGGCDYTRTFDSVSKGLGSTCGLLLGEIVGYCEMEARACLKSQDGLAFEMGISISTCKRALNKLIKEGLIFSTTNISNIPQKFSVNNDAIREFDNNYVLALNKFYEIEKGIVSRVTEDTPKGCIVENKEGLKILRRYVNMYYKGGLWYVKITKIENKEYQLTEFEVF